MKVSNTKVTKKFLVALALVSGASFVHADYKLVPADDSALSKVCIAAAEHGARDDATLAAAAEAGIGLLDLPTVRCNGLTLENFAARYRAKKNQVALLDTSSPAGPLGVILRKTDSSPETELCAAAAISDAAYERVKEEHFAGALNLEAEVKCNGLPLKVFARKYRSLATALVSAR